MSVNKILDYMVTIFAIIVLGIVGIAATVEAADLPFVVNSTAYCNPAGNKTADGSDTIEGVTIAGKKEWLGCIAALYEIKEDGNVGDFIGYRTFTDTGYGVDSQLYPGKGTIETGETIDIYFDKYETAKRWGDRKIYVQVIKGEG